MKSKRETITKRICPYCGSEVSETWVMCCSEVHCEEIEVCAYCEEPECNNECQTKELSDDKTN